MAEMYKVIKKLQLQQGSTERGDWRSQDIVVEAQQNVQYPDRYLLHFTGSGVDKLGDINEGDIVTAMWSANVREYKTKNGNTAYVQEMRCWKIDGVSQKGNDAADEEPF